MATDVTKSTYYASEDAAIQKVISILKGEIGYLEKKDATASALDDKTKNAGYNNYTKYWRDINNWGLMGYPKGWAGGPEWSWCAGLLHWTFVNAFGKDLAKSLLLHAPYISCYRMGILGNEAKQLYTTPKVGDIVLFYSKNANFYHTGYVYKVDSTTYYTIEGNTSASSTVVVANGGCVAYKQWSISTAKSAGHKFFRPNYSIVVKAVEEKKTVETKTATTKKDTDTKTTTSTNKTDTKKKTKVYYTVNTKKDPLNCRVGANTNSSIIGTFKKGTKVELLEKTTSSWFKVKGKSMEGKSLTGYCASSYLKKV